MLTLPLPIGLIGGQPTERIAIACRLRRSGFPVFSEFKNRKRSAMFAKAQEQAKTIYDLDKISDQETLCWLFRGIGEAE